MHRFEGKVAVIAGAATGVGAETARRLASEGAQVVVGDVNLEGAQSTAAGIAETGGTAVPFAFDLTDEASVSALMQAAVDTYGGIDVLFNNGADLSTVTVTNDTDAVTIDVDHWDYILRVNLRGYLFACRHAIPHMLRRGGGAIVCTSSDESFIVSSFPGHVAYQAAKAGVVALVHHVVSRWGKESIRCNCVSPGAIQTESFARNLGDFADLVDEIAANNPSGRLGKPSDIAGTVAFLLSEDAAWVNGQVIHVNGGRLV